jgi:hypothetical protein
MYHQLMRLAVKVDRNYSYAVFVSYSEVYNEKVSCWAYGVFLADRADF